MNLVRVPIIKNSSHLFMLGRKKELMNLLLYIFIYICMKTEKSIFILLNIYTLNEKETFLIMDTING